MKIYAKSQYAVKAIFEMIYNFPGVPVKTAEIARRQQIPKPFLEQIFNKLMKMGIVESKRGAKGGYIVKKYPSELTIGDIILIFYNKKEEQMAKGVNIVDSVLKEGAKRYFDYLNSISFEDLCKKARKAGIKSEYDKSYIFSI